MRNLVLILSVIKTPNRPLSYTPIRSVFSREERFEQTKMSIQSVREKMPDSKIMLVEYSELTEEENKYFNDNVDIFINFRDDKGIESSIYGISKSLGEGMMMIKSLDWLLERNIYFDNIYKLSGRYYLNDKFDITTYNSENVFRKIPGFEDKVSTVFYKINGGNAKTLFNYLIDKFTEMRECVGYEDLIGEFALKLEGTNPGSVKFTGYLGVNGKVAICGSDYEG